MNLADERRVVTMDASETTEDDYLPGTTSLGFALRSSVEEAIHLIYEERAPHADKMGLTGAARLEFILFGVPLES
jgi:hypothetical protein